MGCTLSMLGVLSPEAAAEPPPAPSDKKGRSRKSGKKLESEGASNKKHSTKTSTNNNTTLTTEDDDSLAPKIVTELTLDLNRVEIIEDTVRENLALLKGSAYDPEETLVFNNQESTAWHAAAANARPPPPASSHKATQGNDQLPQEHAVSMQSIKSGGSISTPPKNIVYRNAKTAKLLCRDEFKSKKNNKIMYRWREVSVIEVQGADNSQLFIHFDGWATTFDQWIDLHKDIQKIAAPNILTKEEIESGKMLRDDQVDATKEYLIYGSIRKKEKSIKVTEAPKERKLKTVQSERSNQSNDSDGTSMVDSFFAGMKLDVLDVYYKNGSDKPHHKWREAQVLNILGNRIKVCYVGWDNKFDETLDVIKDKARIAKHLSKCHKKVISDDTSVISARKSASFLKKMGLELDLNKAMNRSTGNEESVGGTAAGGESTQLDESFFLSKFGKRIIKKFKSTLPIRKSTKRGPDDNIPDADDDVEAAIMAAQLNDPTMKSSAQIMAEIQKEKDFIAALKTMGLTVVEIEGDGNCMFRAVSHQLHLNEKYYDELRQRCVEHLIANKSRFSVFCSDDFDEHVERMKTAGVWGDELELRALEEIIDRQIKIFSTDSPDPKVPISQHETIEGLDGVTPLTLSYHGSNHYNSVNDDAAPLPLRFRKSTVLYDWRNKLFLADQSPVEETKGTPKSTKSSNTKSPNGRNASNPQNTNAQQSPAPLQRKNSKKNMSSGTSVNGNTPRLPSQAPQYQYSQPPSLQPPNNNYNNNWNNQSYNANSQARYQQNGAMQVGYSPHSASPSPNMMNAYPQPGQFMYQNNAVLPVAAGPSPRTGRSNSAISPPSGDNRTLNQSSYRNNNPYQRNG